ncbi:MAG: hypothetical protein M3Q57_04885, partial [Pseudomonadota bacterium]|nr:hypothetical protein [Pseudomonadota bacterium]
MPETLQDKLDERSILLMTGTPQRLEMARRLQNLASMHALDDHTIATANIDAIEPRDTPQLLYFGGYAFAGDLMVTDLGTARKSRALSFENVQETSGGFCSIFAANGGLRVSTDVFGMFGLYHSIGPDYAVIGSRFYEVVKALKALGVALSIDDAATASALMPVGRLFEQATSPRTLCAQINFLPIGHAVWLRRGRAELVDTGVIGRIRDGNGASYADLVRQGTKAVASNVLAAFNQSHAMLGIGLSGGYDSRVLLGALLHLGLEK